MVEENLPTYLIVARMASRVAYTVIWCIGCTSIVTHVTAFVVDGKFARRQWVHLLICSLFVVKTIIANS